MKKLTITLVFVFLVFLSMTTFGNLMAEEIQFPKISQKASVSQTIGLTDVTITYHRPGVKGRVIWGDLVPYDKLWRTGANNATTISFSHDVTVEGNKLPAGTYGLFTIPGQEEWTFVFSKQSDIWGAYGYKEDQDVLRIKVKPASIPHCEWMRFCFSDLSENAAKVNLEWEKLTVGFTVNVETQKMVLESIEKTLGRYWVPPYYSADHAFKNKMLDKAKEWIDMSTAIKVSYWNMLLKAKIYKEMAKTKMDTKEAIKILEKANLLIKDLPEGQKQYATEGEELLKEWKSKKK